MGNAVPDAHHFPMNPRLAGLRGLNGLIVPSPVGLEHSSEAGPVTGLTTTVTGPLFRPAVAIWKNVTRDSSKMVVGVIGHLGLLAR